MTTGRQHKPRLIVAITGSSGPHLGKVFLEVLREHELAESHVVVSRGARRSIELEMGIDPSEVERLGHQTYDPDNLGAAISSGSFQTDGMVVIPCSMKTLGTIATGTGENLVARAADVTLKERRPLVLVARETPLNLVHIRNMEAVTLAGATVLPAIPGFYHHPETIHELLLHTCGKVLDQFRIPHDLFQRWQ